MREAVILVEALAVLLALGYSPHRPMLFQQLDRRQARREEAFDILDNGTLDRIVLECYDGFKKHTGRTLPEEPLDLLGWFGDEFSFLLPLYVEFSRALKESLTHYLRVPVTDLQRMDYVPVAPVANSFGLPSKVVVDHLKLSDAIDCLLEHEAGLLIRHDMLHRVRSAAETIAK
ncbi:hypothetical protein [Devosia sp.]|uniref:hypothetical protein n=1 Tax=Devosia sp. TaxID=1871048 RepID=UPI0025E8150F|nr:hypothetical protein [Devosia sp.]MCR6634759.1 hypothetical protein [Devosia sp.]